MLLRTFRRLLQPDHSAQVLFYAASWIDETWIRSTAEECGRRGWKTLLAVGGQAPAADVARYEASGVSVIDKIVPDALRAVRTSIAVTASSGIPADWFSAATRYRIHMPHSLVSLHMVYPANAFDGYNVLFAAGPHHIAEFEALSRLRHLSDRSSRAIGYGKTDILPAATYREQAAGQRRVLVAPSWGPDSLLPRVGRALIGELLARGYDVTLRPHPMQVDNEDPALTTIVEAFAGSEFRVELPSTPPVSMAEADMFITDYSGTAFEYALLRRRPIVFVDVPKKVVNPSWREVGLTPVELSVRERIGVVTPVDVSVCVDAVDRVAQDLGGWEAKIEEALRDFVFRPISVAATACDHIGMLLEEGARRPAVAS